MSRIRLKYIDHFADRHGTLRYYFRRPGGKRVPLPGMPGSEPFMEAYQRAEAETKADKPVKERGAVGTFGRLLSAYYDTTDYKALKPQTQRQYRLAMERLIEKEGLKDRRVKDIQRPHIKRMMAKVIETPSSANDRLKKLRILLKFAIDLGWRKDDPTLHVKKLKEGEHHTWTDEQVEAFESHWPLGTQQRTAFALLLYTGQRVSDVARMSWSDVSLDGHRIAITQEKTGSKLDLQLHDDLLAALARWPRSEAAILCTAYGKPFSVKGLGNKMAEAFDAAGLPEECVTHGLRKAAARRLAEAGCSPHEIASITGHKTLSEIERYTRAVEQRRLNDAANSKLRRTGLPTLADKNPQTEG
jgi:integrase